MSVSAPSSSGTWSGAGECRGGVTRSGAVTNIIDLDKFMRGAVRPSPPRARPHPRRSVDTRAHCEQLVVDAGGVERRVSGAGALSADSTSGASAPRTQHCKRYSHDSGLSDGSCTTRKHRRGRSASEVTRAPSTASLRAFRIVCERALLDQQAQIARVAQLCERLTEQRAPPAPALPHHEAPPRSSSTSDATTSSRSTRTKDARRDKHRTEGFNTYKIIMCKLDELSRLLAARGRPAHRPRLPSTASVSVSDKLVCTEPETVFPQVVQVARAQTPGGVVPSQTPTAPLPHDTALMDSMAQCAAGSTLGCAFDLDDPVRLYAQAKELQALRGAPLRAGQYAGEHIGEHVGRDLSLCALCRSYWRSVRHVWWPTSEQYTRWYVSAQMWCGPADAR